MNFLRKTEKKKISEDIRNLENYNKTDTATISRFKAAPATDFSENQIKKLSLKIKDRKNTISSYRERLNNIDTGIYDNELEQAAQKVINEANRKRTETLRKKAEIQAQEKEKKAKSKIFYQAERQVDRQSRYLEKNSEKAYSHFTRACNSVPDYINKKLSRMPNNMGYIWKNVHCYGELEAEEGKPIIMFERTRNGTQLIHETSEYQYKIYQKGDKGRKTLIECHDRKTRC